MAGTTLKDVDGIFDSDGYEHVDEDFAMLAHAWGLAVSAVVFSAFFSVCVAVASTTNTVTPSWASKSYP